MNRARRRRALRSVAAAALVVVVGASACVTEPSPVSLPEGDPVGFALEVQPVLDRRCASPSCHGQAARPLAVYSPGAYRSDPDRTFLREPLTEAELAANARNVAAFALDVDRLDDVLVVKKPLPVELGGCWHGGGVVFRTLDERDLRALRAWIAPLVDGGGDS